MLNMSIIFFLKEYIWKQIETRIRGTVHKKHADFHHHVSFDCSFAGSSACLIWVFRWMPLRTNQKWDLCLHASWQHTNQHMCILKTRDMISNLYKISPVVRVLQWSQVQMTVEQPHPWNADLISSPALHPWFASYRKGGANCKLQWRMEVRHN